MAEATIVIEFKRSFQYCTATVLNNTGLMLINFDEMKCAFYSDVKN